MCLNLCKYGCFSKGALSATFPEKVGLGLPKSELLGSFWALFGTMGLTLVPFLAIVVPSGALGVPIRILVDF